MDDDRTAKLTEGQKACLRLVLGHMSSKDIARTLEISPHTVDQRLKQAMKTLGAASRVDAARILAAAESEGRYQSLVHQRPDLAGRAEPPPPPTHDLEVRKDDRLRKITWLVALIAGVAVGLAALFVGLNALAEFTR